MDDVSVFEFKSYLEFLRKRIALSRSQRGRYTLKWWAHKLQYRSPRSISLVLSGQRIPSHEMALKLGRALKLREDEQHYFELLISLERNRRNKKDLASALRAIESANPKAPDALTLTREEFARISRWYYLVVRQLIRTPDFREDLNWMRGKLRNKVSNLELERAVQVLEGLKLVERSPLTKKLRHTERPIYTQTDLTSEAVQRHLRQMMLRATEALREQSVVEREMTSVTFRMDRDRLEEGKQRIRAFRDRFNKELSSSGSNAVWQLNIQFFEHTRR